LAEAGHDIELPLDVVVEEVGRANHGEDLTALRVDGDEVPVVRAQRAQALLADRDRVLGGLL